MYHPTPSTQHLSQTLNFKTTNYETTTTTTSINYWLMAIGLWLLAYGLQAQEFQWVWAKSGGGGLSGSDSVFNEQQDETIRDIVVDADNNYYFLADLQ